MGRPSNERFRERFTINLGRLLDLRDDVPREPAARASELARVCAVTPAAARKWLTGAGWPTLEKILELSQRFEFAPEELLSDGPRRIVDISRLVDAQALQRAELAELTPVPEFDLAQPSLLLAVDPVVLCGQAEVGRSERYALFTVHDASMAPHCVAGDRVVFRLDPLWQGDGLYVMQSTLSGPPALRTVTRIADAYRVAASAPAFSDQAFETRTLASHEADALTGAPLLRGRPVGLWRALPFK
ncbi:MAG: hypothetical protein H7125_16060 [Proteobacteria bacterium]|nr:hypothetical protein [Burkholderiales bacterium]